MRLRQPLKYGNKITERDGIKFRSLGEANRYSELKLLSLAGEIRDLKLQVVHQLIGCNDEPLGITYCSDYEYSEKSRKSPWGWVHIIEDFKGKGTDLFWLKWAIMQAMFRSSIQDGSVQMRITSRNRR